MESVVTGWNGIRLTLAPHFDAGNLSRVTPLSIAGSMYSIPGVYRLQTMCTQLAWESDRYSHRKNLILRQFSTHSPSVHCLLEEPSQGGAELTGLWGGRGEGEGRVRGGRGLSER